MENGMKKFNYEYYNFLELLEFTRKTLEKGTEVGFNKQEIKKTSTEDLLTLRKSILLYLKSKKLKKRNANFMDVYYRINEELKERKHISKKEEESVNSGFVKAEIASQSKLNLNSESHLSNDDFVQESKIFLKRKHSMSLEVDIPSFLNDKKQKKEISISTKNDEIEKPNLKPFLNGNLYIILILNKILLKIFNHFKDFGKGLFDEKVDFDPSDDMDNFKIFKKQSFDYELKEIEIKSAIFNAVPEDLFFSLD